MSVEYQKLDSQTLGTLVKAGNRSESVQERSSIADGKEFSMQLEENGEISRIPPPPCRPCRSESLE